MNHHLIRLGLAALALATALTTRDARAVDGPPINPFECYGIAQFSTQDRTVEQMEHELDRLMNPLYKKEDPDTRRAIKACAVARIKARVGHADAEHYFLEAIKQNPEEPGFELWAGEYFAGFRGAGRPIYRKAEKHLYAALEKLEALEKAGKRMPYHDHVESWVNKRLMVLYQEDGLPITPWWKGYPYDSSGLYPPSAFVSSQFAISQDTRDFFRNNEQRIFTSEAAFASSSVRRGGIFQPLTEEERRAIIRTPLRYQVDNRLRIRENWLGAIDLLHSYHKMANGQITTFYFPDGFPNSNEDGFNDVSVTQLGGGYTRSLDLYPLFDFRLRGSVRYVERTGVVEFLPDYTEKFPMYEIKPSFSRSIGADKLTVNLTYVRLAVPDLPNGVRGESKRDHVIRAGEVVYAIYSPIWLPQVELGSLFRGRRRATRGWYWYGGFAQTDQAYGVRTVHQSDIYLGTRLETPGNWDLWLHGGLYTSDTEVFDINRSTATNAVTYFDETQSFKTIRTAAIFRRRVVSWDTLPAVQGSWAGLALDELNLVMPISWDYTIQNAPNFNKMDTAVHTTDYENVRIGLESWMKLLGTGFWGAGILTTIGADAQYFYNLDKFTYGLHANVRLGWQDEL